VVVSVDLAREVQEVVEALESKQFREWVTDPVFWHGGILVSADASTSEGWGLHVGGVCAQGRWEDDTVAAIKSNREKRLDLDTVSISPLELAAQVLILLVVLATCGRPPNGQMILRCGNLSAVIVTETRRPRSPAMRRALVWLQRVEAEFDVFVRLEHIATKKNKLADALSRFAIRDTNLALAELGVAEVPFSSDEVVWNGQSLGDVCKEMERDVREAIHADLDVEESD
jgi:hypothetical protein